MSTCILEDCSNSVHARGLCPKHYQQDRTKAIPKKQFPSICTLDGCDCKHYAKGVCTIHYDRMRTTGSYEDRYQQMRASASETHKVCTRCQEFKSLDQFNNLKQGFLGKTSYCKSCIFETYTPETRERKRRYRAIRKYGPDAEALLDVTKCEICESNQRLSIDHDHVTGKVRGLLCSKHNTALGMVNDSIEELEGLIAYLRKHSDTKDNE